MRKTKTILTAIIAVLFTSLFRTGCLHNPAPNNPSELEGKLLILQAYASTYDAAGASHSFVELYNVTDAEINLSGISLYYAAPYESSAPEYEDDIDMPWKRIALSETIPAKGSFLVLGPRENIKTAGVDGASRYQIPDGYGDINDSDFTLHNRAFKVALIEGSENLNVQNPFDINGEGTKINGYIDMVGAINTAGTDRIFGYETAPARCSASEAVRRNSLVDTDNNQGKSSAFPDGTGDFNSIRYATGGMTNAELEVRKPRNSSAGSWNPFADPAAPPAVEGLMIFQVHGTGFEDPDNGNNKNTGAISHNFVELYNNSNTAIDFNAHDYSVQWANGIANGGGTVTTEEGDWNVIVLTGIIPAYSSYLIRGKLMNESAGTADNIARLDITACDLDEGANFEMSNRSFKVAIVSSHTKLGDAQPWDNDADPPGPKATSSALLDLVGAKNGNNDSTVGFKGALITTYSKQQSMRRKALADTGNNVDDYVGINYNNGEGGNAEGVAKFRPRTASKGSWTPEF